MEQKKIGIGIIGCGKIAQTRHIPEYAQNPNAELIGYYDFIYERAEEMAKIYGGRAFSTVEGLLNSAEIDAVSICTANNAHASMTVAALVLPVGVVAKKGRYDMFKRMHSRNIDHRLSVGSFKSYVIGRYRVFAQAIHPACKNTGYYAHMVNRKALYQFHFVSSC